MAPCPNVMVFNRTITFYYTKLSVLEEVDLHSPLSQS